MGSKIISNIKQLRATKDLDNLKSDYFLIKMFDLIKQNKALKIIKYNKKIQKRLNINIKNYKECSQLYSPIELELKLEDNEYGKFINIPDEEKEFFHIYFNNSKKEIKRNYLIEKEKVKRIKIIINYQVKSFENLLYDCLWINSIYFIKFDRNDITNMRSMFNKCISLKELNISNFNTTNVTNMSFMFSRCSSLKELYISNFNTNNVTNMRSMFSECSSLIKLNLSNFNNNNVRIMRNMFYKCSSLKELNLFNFNTNNVTNMSEMFFKCSSLKELNLSNFNTNKV